MKILKYCFASKIEEIGFCFISCWAGRKKSYTVPNEGMSLEKGKLYKCNILVNRYPGWR